MRKLLPFSVLGIGFMLATLTGCGSSGDTSKVIKIVSSLPRTGSAKAQTDSLVNGIKMAIDESGGKAGPFTIDYVDWDDSTAATGDWAPEAEAANADRAVKNPDVMV